MPFVFIRYQLLRRSMRRLKIAPKYQLLLLQQLLQVFCLVFNLIRKAIKNTTEIRHNFPDCFHHIGAVLSLYHRAKGICLQGCYHILKACTQTPFLPALQGPRNSHHGLQRTDTNSRCCSEHFAPTFDLESPNYQHWAQPTVRQHAARTENAWPFVNELFNQQDFQTGYWDTEHHSSRRNNRTRGKNSCLS